MRRKLVLAWIPVFLMVLLITPVLAYFTVTSTSQNDGGFDFAWERQGFYQRDFYWVFYADSVSGCENSVSDICLWYASSSAGVTWATTSIDVRTRDSYYGVMAKNNLAYYVRYNGTATNDVGGGLYFRKGTINLGGTITWDAETVVKAGATNVTYDNPVVMLDTSDQAFVGFNKRNITTAAPDTPYVIRSTGTDYSTWTEETQLTTNSAAWRLNLVALSSAKVYVTYWTLSGFNYQGRLYNAGWGSAQNVMSRTGGVREAFLFAQADTVYASWHEDAELPLRFAVRDPNGQTWGADETIVNGETTGRAKWTVSFDSEGPKFYLFYYNTTDAIVWKVEGLTGSWGAKTDFSTTGTTDSTKAISSYHYSGTKSSGDRVVGVFWTDAPSGTKKVQHDIITITVGAPQEPPPPAGGGGGGIPSGIIEDIPRTAVAVVLEASKFVLAWPLTFFFGLFTSLITAIGQFTGRQLLRDSSIVGLVTVIANWFLGNAQSLLGLDLAPFSQYAFREPALTITLFGLSSSLIAFGLVIAFIGGLAVTGAVALALRD